VIAALGTLAVAPVARAGTLTVDDDGADCPAAAYQSVQSAVSAAQTGDTVVICPGEYVEGSGAPGTNALTITKSIELRGAGADLVSISPKAAPLVGGRILEDAPDIRNGVGDIVAIVGTPTQPLTVKISGVTVDGYDPDGRPVAVEAGILYLDAKGEINRARVTNVVTSEGDNAYLHAGGWRGTQPGIGIVQTSNALLAPVDGARQLKIDRTRVDKYNKIGILIDGAQNDVAPFIASGTVNRATITASQIVGRTECVNYAGTGNCAQVGLLTSGPLFGQDGLRVTNGAYATVDSSLVTQNLVNGTGAPTRNSTENNANLTLGAGLRFIGAKLTSYTDATGLLTHSQIGTSNITDNAYGAINVTADGSTPQVGYPVPIVARPPGAPNNYVIPGYGPLLRAEGNWWGLRYNSTANPGPAISPTTNPQVPENPVNGVSAPDTTDAAGPVTSNAVDYYPYRDGPQANPTSGEYPVLSAPIPMDDAAPNIALSAPASIARGTTLTLTANVSDDFGIKRVRFAEGAATVGTATMPPYTAAISIPATAACGSTRTFSAVATDSGGQTAAGAPVTVAVTCPASVGPDVPEPTATPAPKDVALLETGLTAPGAPSVSFLSAPSSIARRASVAFKPVASAGVKQLDVFLGSRKVCTIAAAPYSCEVVAVGADVGSQALRVVLTDNAGASAEASRSVAVAKFAAKLSLRVVKSNVAGRKARRTVLGTLQVPEGVTKAQACKSGSVTVAVKRGGRSVLNQQVRLSKSCTFQRSVTAGRGKQAFSISAKFGGNGVLATAGSTRRFS
jgi:hypothetical protein